MGFLRQKPYDPTKKDYIFIRKKTINDIIAVRADDILEITMTLQDIIVQGTAVVDSQCDS